MKNTNFLSSILLASLILTFSCQKEKAIFNANGGNNALENSTTLTKNQALSGSELIFIDNLETILDSHLSNNTQSIISSNPNNPFDEDGYLWNLTFANVIYNNQAAIYNNEDPITVINTSFTEEMISVNKGWMINTNPNFVSVNAAHYSLPEINLTNWINDLHGANQTSLFCQSLGNMIKSKIMSSSGNLNSRALIISIENEIIANSDLFTQVEYDDFLLAASIARNSSASDIGAILLAARWWEHPCLGFGLSFVGSFMGGPFTAIMGIGGMINSAAGCERALR